MTRVLRRVGRRQSERREQEESMDVSDDQPILTDVPGPRGRRGIVSALGAAGVALLAALGRSDTASASGIFRTTRVVSDPSTPLPTTENGATNVFASCADGRKPISCG